MWSACRRSWACLVVCLTLVGLLTFSGCGAAPQGDRMSARPDESEFETATAIPADAGAPEGMPSTEWDGDGATIASFPAPMSAPLPSATPHPESALQNPSGGAAMPDRMGIDATHSMTTSPIAEQPSQTMAAPLPADLPRITYHLPRQRLPTMPATISRIPENSPDDMLVATSVSHVDAIVNRLDYGTVVYNAPPAMTFGEARVIEVLLSPTQTATQLQQAMINAVDVQSATLQVANKMEAKLTGSGFDIEALSEPLQAITSSRPTQWRFKVTPVSHGPQELHLSLLAHIDIHGDDAPLVVETKDAIINVNITLAQRVAGFVSTNWQWLWAAVIFPIITFSLRRRNGQDRRHAAA